MHYKVSLSHRPLHIGIMTLTMILMAFSTLHAEERGPVCDLDAARALCDSAPLEGPEGIWQYPEDHVTVLVMKSAEGEGYQLTVVQSEDTSLLPGEVLGTLTPSLDSGKFKLSIYTIRKKGRLSDLRDCLVTLSSDGETMRVEKAGVDFSFNPLGFLSGFRRVLRMKIKDPAADLPDGMTRIYPSYDGNGSSRRHPRYL